MYSLTSTCNHTPYRRQTSAISGNGSKAPRTVVPDVATVHSGAHPSSFNNDIWKGKIKLIKNWEVRTEVVDKTYQRNLDRGLQLLGNHPPVFISLDYNDALRPEPEPVSRLSGRIVGLQRHFCINGWVEGVKGSTLHQYIYQRKYTN